MGTPGNASPAFAACEALFDAHPEAVADEGDSGRLMCVTVPGGRIAGKHGAPGEP